MKDKKKAMIAAQGENSDESDSETEVCKNEVTNLCLIALGNEDEINDEFFTLMNYNKLLMNYMLNL